MIPKAFYITSGMGMAYDHDAAFDLALQDAGIGECNLVEVSSILPAKAEEVDKMSCTCIPGEITFCVLSRMAGKSGELIGAVWDMAGLETQPIAIAIALFLVSSVSIMVITRVII